MKAAILSVLALTVTVTAAPPGSGWRQVWGDEFDGDKVDGTKWSLGNGYKQNQTCALTSNVEVSAGTVKIKAYKDGNNACGLPYTGGILWGKKKDILYGYMEAKLRYDVTGPGHWGNFWTTSAQSWPPEFDLAEMTSNRTDRLFIANQYKDASGTKQVSSYYHKLDYKQWHVYGCEYPKDGSVKFYVDGQMVFDSKVKTMIYPQYIILRQSGPANASWGGDPNSTTKYPGIAEYDWVRVYERSGATEVSVPAVEAAVGGSALAIRTHRDGWVLSSRGHSRAGCTVRIIDGAGRLEAVRELRASGSGVTTTQFRTNAGLHLYKITSADGRELSGSFVTRHRE